MSSLLDDPFAHHVWATERLIDACATLTREQSVELPSIATLDEIGLWVHHHGTDHRSQVCTALTSHGTEPPKIDLWAYGEETGLTRAIEG